MGCISSSPSDPIPIKPDDVKASIEEVRIVENSKPKAINASVVQPIIHKSEAVGITVNDIMKKFNHKEAMHLRMLAKEYEDFKESITLAKDELANLKPNIIVSDNSFPKCVRRILNKKLKKAGASLPDNDWDYGSIMQKTESALKWRGGYFSSGLSSWTLVPHPDPLSVLPDNYEKDHMAAYITTWDDLYVIQKLRGPLSVVVTDTAIYFGVEVKEMPPKCSGWGMVFSPVRSNWEEEAEIKDKKSMEQRNLDRMKIEASSLKERLKNLESNLDSILVEGQLKIPDRKELIKVFQALLNGSYTFVEDTLAAKYLTDLPPTLDVKWKDELLKLAKDFKPQKLPQITSLNPVDKPITNCESRQIIASLFDIGKEVEISYNFKRDSYTIYNDWHSGHLTLLNKTEFNKYTFLWKNKAGFQYNLTADIDDASDPNYFELKADYRMAETGFEHWEFNLDGTVLMWHDKNGCPRERGMHWIVNFDDEAIKVKRLKIGEISKKANKTQIKVINENEDIIKKASGIITTMNYDQVLTAFLLDEKQKNIDFLSHYNKLQFLFEATFHVDSAEFCLHISKKIATLGSNANILYNQYMILSLLQPIVFTKEGPMLTSTAYAKPLNSLNDLPERWIFFNSSVMSEFVKAGYFDQLNDRSSETNWWEVFNLFHKLATITHPSVKASVDRAKSTEALASVIDRLAVAIALRWANPENLGAVSLPGAKEDDLMQKHAVDPFARFQRYVKLYESNRLMQIFETLSTWHLGYVIDSRRTDYELDWILNSPSLIAKNGVHISKMSQNDGVLTAVEMMPCKIVKGQKPPENAIDCYNEIPFFEIDTPERPRKSSLLEDWWRVGGVCFHHSNGGANVCKSLGFPGIPISQPGHVAYVHMLEEGPFQLSFTNHHNWNLSTIINGKRKNAAFVIELMSECQRNPQHLLLSEAIRFASSFSKFDSSDASTSAEVSMSLLRAACHACPMNFLSWRERIYELDKISRMGDGVSVFEKELVAGEHTIELEYERDHGLEIKEYSYSYISGGNYITSGVLMPIGPPTIDGREDLNAEVWPPPEKKDVDFFEGPVDVTHTLTDDFILKTNSYIEFNAKKPFQKAVEPCMHDVIVDAKSGTKKKGIFNNKKFTLKYSYENKDHEEHFYGNALISIGDHDSSWEEYTFDIWGEDSSLKDIVEIRKLVLKWNDINKEPKKEAKQKFKVSTSIDGKTWKHRRTELSERDWVSPNEFATTESYFPIYNQGSEGADHSVSYIEGWSKGLRDTRYIRIEYPSIDDKHYLLGHPLSKVIVTYSTSPSSTDLEVYGRHLLRYWNGGPNTRYIDANLPLSSSFVTNTHLVRKAGKINHDAAIEIKAPMPFSEETVTRSYLFDGFEDERIVNLTLDKYAKASYEYDNFPATSVTQYYNDTTGGGSGSFWISPEEKAWLELDLGVYQCQVKDVRILWGFHKMAPKFTIYTSEGPYKPWKKVGDQSTASNTQNLDVLDWTSDISKLLVNEPSMGTRRIKIEMEGGVVSWVNYQGLGKGNKLTRYNVQNIEVHGYRREYPQAKSLYERIVANSIKSYFSTYLTEDEEIQGALNYAPENLTDAVGKAFLGTYHEKTVAAEETYGYDEEK